MTPHIEAEIGEIAPIVIMPGDPLRAQMIAEKFLLMILEIFMHILVPIRVEELL